MAGWHVSEISPRILVLIPGKDNSLYDQLGARIVEAFGEIGIPSEAKTLGEIKLCGDTHFDLCLISNISEVLVNFGEMHSGLSLIRQLLTECKSGGMGLVLDSVSTQAFAMSQNHLTQVGALGTLDLGIFDQRYLLASEWARTYRFVFNGLTRSEAIQAKACMKQATPRQLPWALIGSHSTRTIGVVDQLIHTVDASGVVYIPYHIAETENGPYLDQREFEQILSRCKYQVWSSNQESFYMEVERFRSSLLTGSVPIKVMEAYQAIPDRVPFRYLLISSENLGQRLSSGIFERIRHQFAQDFLHAPTLSEGLLALVQELGLLPTQVEVRNLLRQAG